MRPVNLIPENQRRRRSGAGRTGPLAFIVVGALFVALAGVVALIITSNQVSERESELTSLNARNAAVRTRADRLSPFVDFKEVKDQRTETIRTLADARFNWSRVLQELSRVMPRYVVLSTISGSAGKGVNLAKGARDPGEAIKGPSLSLTGCASSQSRVAQMVAALKRIDGVTRVGLEGSGIGGSSSEKGDEQTCPASYAFALVATFDGAPLPIDSSEAVSASSESTAGSEEESSESESNESTSGTGETETTTTSGSTTKTVTTRSVPPKS